MLEQLREEGVPEAKLHVGRFKGLGEMNPEQLKETTMHRDTRRLLRIALPNDPARASRMFAMLMGKGAASDRRAWMEAKGDAVEVDA
jgi:topoisomerase-4 subunit B